MVANAGKSGSGMVLVVVGVVVIAGLAWWALAGGTRPRPVPPAVGSSFVVPKADDELGLRALLKNPAAIARGDQVFKGLCITCHGAYGEGTLLGPNLRDDHWLNGSSMTDLVHIISEGKPGTAMQPMRLTFSASDIAAVATYVVSLKGGTAGSDKAAEGDFSPITYWP